MRLRELQEKDAPFMYEWMNDRDITSCFQVDFANMTLENCKSFISNKSSNNFHMAVADDNDEYMGTVSLKNITDKEAEFAIVLRSKAHGKGYASFGMKEIIAIGFNKYNLDYIFWNVYKDNSRAIKFYDKNGYKRTDYKTIECIGTRYPMEQSLIYLWYRITREEFEKQANLGKIMPNRMDRGFYKYQNEFEDKAIEVLRSGWYVLGNEVKSFEEEFASYLGVNHCVGLASGLDALWIAFRLLGIGVGDEVIVQANTYIASVMGITINGATPVFVEPDEYFSIDASAIEEKITDKTKAVLVVHLYGQSADMGAIVDICKKHHLRLVEDCAQSHGSTFNRKMTGTFGDIGCFSFYPSKNLGAFGDGGAIITNDATIAENARIFRNYGSEKRYYNKVVGANSRLDEIQAGLLRVRLTHLDELTEEKKKISERYLREIKNPKITLPLIRENTSHIWHQFVIRSEERDRLAAYLDQNGVGTIIHYPIPPHLSEAYSYLGVQEGSLPITEHYAKTVLSIPLYNGMTEEEQSYVIDLLNRF